MNALEVAPFTTSIVLGNDLVCRLNYHALFRLRNNILDSIARARVNKMVILKAVFRDVDPLDLLYPPGQEPESEFKQSVEKFKVRKPRACQTVSIPRRGLHDHDMDRATSARD